MEFFWYWQGDGNICETVTQYVGSGVVTKSSSDTDPESLLAIQNPTRKP